MKKIFCDRCEKEKVDEEVGQDRVVVKEYSKPDGSKGPQLRMLIELPFFVNGTGEPEFCKTCFEEIVMEFMAEEPKKHEEPKPATTSTEEDIPF